MPTLLQRRRGDAGRGSYRNCSGGGGGDRMQRRKGRKRKEKMRCFLTLLSKKKKPMPCRLIVFDSRLGAREGDDGQKLLASYPPTASASTTRAIVGLAGGLIAYGAAWEGIGGDGGGDDDDERDENDETEIDAPKGDDQSSSLSAVRPLERGFAVHLERSRWVMHRASPGVWWLLVRLKKGEREREGDEDRFWHSSFFCPILTEKKELTAVKTKTLKKKKNSR